MRVLVTGGSGFIGSHVVDALLAAGHEPLIYDLRRSPYHDDVPCVTGDLCELDRLSAALDGCDAVLHLAAAADVNEVLAEPVEAERRNACGTLHVLEAARQAGVGRVVYASTIWAYSDTPADHHEESLPLHPPAHLYTATKLAGELYCHSYGELYGVEHTILRFGIPYGPRARPAAVVPTFVTRALAGEPLTIAGDGSQSRRFVYVEDLADGVVRALAPCAVNRTYNLVGEADVSIRDIADAVRSVVGEVEVVHTPGRTGDFAGAPVSGERAAAELGWRPATPFADGVRRYVEWHRAAEALPEPAHGWAHRLRPAPALAALGRRTLASAPPPPARGALARRAALGLAWAAAISVGILGLLSLMPNGPTDRYDTFLDSLLLMLPLVLAGGFAWEDRTAGPLRAALWVVAFGLLFSAVVSWPSLLDRIADSHRVILVLLALSTATAARLLGRRPLLYQWLGASGD
jgi:UDP-glucose 4-epimerase